MEQGFSQELAQLVRVLEHPEKLLAAVSRTLAEESIDLIKQGFRDQADPYGARWKPKKRPDGRAILTGRTGRLKGGYHVVRVGPDGFTVASSVVYSRYHQDGRVRRMMVPDEGLGMPPSWARTYEEATHESLEILLGKGGAGP